MHSNTTNVKVKQETILKLNFLEIIQIQPMLRLNVCFLLLYVTSVLYSNTTNVKVKQAGAN